MSNNFETAKNIHFIGIGGIGISAIARMFLFQGKKVSGSDGSESEITQALIKLGATIFIGQKAENIPPDTELIIYTVAIKKDNPELIEAVSRGLKIMTYAEVLHEISKNKYTIAVSGTHGKTTVTAMIAHLLIDTKCDPTVIVGSLIKSPKQSLAEKSSLFKNIESTNYIAGQSDLFVVEACEYERSFLNIEPKIIVINNIDADHLDYYGDLDGVITGFNEFALKVPADGFIVCNPNDPKVAKAISNLPNKPKIIDRGKFYNSNLKLKMPGDHNRLNVATALAVGSVLSIDTKKGENILSNFTGIWRRFEFKGETKKGTLVYEDYAHNPQKIKAALAGAKEVYPNKRIVVVFQPHLFSRTKLLLNDFATAFEDADEIVLAPIFPAREKFDPTISSDILAEEIRKIKKISFLPNKANNFSKNVSVFSFSDFSSIINYLKDSLNSNDVLITMGAGEQYKIGEKLLE